MLIVRSLERAETRKSRRSEVAQAAKADAEATQYVAQMLKSVLPYPFLSDVA